MSTFPRLVFVEYKIENIVTAEVEFFSFPTFTVTHDVVSFFSYPVFQVSIFASFVFPFAIRLLSLLHLFLDGYSLWISSARACFGREQRCGCLAR